MLRRHPVLCFYLIVFILVVLGAWIAFFVFHGSLWAQWINVFTPALVALALTAIIDGKPGVTGLLARLFHWRVHLKWYLAVLLLPVLFSLVWVFFNALLDSSGVAAGLEDGTRLLQGFLRGAPGLLLITLLMAVLIAGEEIGWRGYALERLLKSHGPLAASLIVGLLWGIWHLPSALDPASVLNKAPLWYTLPLFTLGTVVFSFVYTWFWQNTRGSLLIACLFHSYYDMLNTFTGALYPSFYTRFWLYLLAMAVILTPAWILLKKNPSSLMMQRRAARNELRRKIF